MGTGMQRIPCYAFRIFTSQRPTLGISWHRWSDNFPSHVDNIFTTPHHYDGRRTQHVLNQTWEKIIFGHLPVVIFDLLFARYQHLHGYQRVSLAFECRYRFAYQTPLDAIWFDEDACSFDIMIAAIAADGCIRNSHVCWMLCSCMRRSAHIC